MDITFNVEKQLICRTDNEIPVAKSENFLFAQFTFSDEWKGTKTAIFNNGTAYNVILHDDRCLVPWEVITDNGFSVSVYCGNRITANTAYVMVIPSGYIEGETPAPPSPTVYDQLTEEISKKQDVLVSGKNIKTINNLSLLGSGNIDIQGGGGTGDYDNLINQPQVNGNKLIGNKTSEQLGLQSELVSGTNIKTINGENVLGSGNVDIPIYSYEVNVEFDQSGDIYLQQSDIDYLYSNQPQTILVNITQGGTIAVRQIYTLIGKFDVVGVKNGLLNYVLLNDVDGFENRFDFIQIPTSSSSKLIIREVYYQEKLTFDSTPTANSTNPVTSAGVKTYVDTAVGNIDTALQGLISGGGVV